MSEHIEVEDNTVTRLTEGVEQMAGAADSLVKELRRHRIRSMTDKVFMWFMALGLVTLSIVAVLGYQEWKRDRVNVKDARIGVACVIEMLEEHRFAQRAAHEAQAEHSGFTYDIPLELTAPSQEEIEELKRRLARSCNGFTRENLDDGGEP